MKKSVLEQTKRRSPLESAQGLKSGTGASASSSVKDLAPTLSLTSLIDAFSILVIYLLVATQDGGIEALTPNDMKLPMAEKGLLLDEKTSVVRIEKGRYFVDEKPVSASQLGQTLYQLKKDSGLEELPLMVQADREMEYADLDPILKAGAEAGIQKLKFAVVPSK